MEADWGLERGVGEGCLKMPSKRREGGRYRWRTEVMFSEVDVPYIPSPLGAIRKMLEIANVGSRDIVYDLGCGDARIPIMAVKEFGVKRAVGYEARKDVYEKALRKVKRGKLLGRVKLVNGDLFKANISEATVITLYLDGPANEQLKPKLEREAKAGTRIVSRSFPVKGWQASREERMLDHVIYLYRIRQAFREGRRRFKFPEN